MFGRGGTKLLLKVNGWSTVWEALIRGCRLVVPCGKQLPYRAAACNPTASLSVVLYQQNEDDSVTQFQKEVQDLVGDHETIGSTRDNELGCVKN